MQSTHIFIVDETTFDLHLKYLFAGTGARDYVIDFNNKPSTNFHHTVENNLAGMISDAQRLRKGDLIIFYLQQKGSRPGKFYGVFKTKEHHSFLDNNTHGQYLSKQLKKSLTFRTLIDPFEVYPKGISEWDALDSIRNLASPNEMIWSLIYRKLKANRGNTMITVFESKRLIGMIKKINSNNKLRGKSFAYDLDTQSIIKTDKKLVYAGRRRGKINILPRLKNKFNNSLQFEKHLQAYITQYIGLNINKPLDRSILTSSHVKWLGNEVSCGVGMQSIDILLLTTKGSQAFTIPIELKSVCVYEGIIFQLQRYVDWLEQYYIPNHKSKIIPTIISRKYEDKTDVNFKKIIKSFNKFNSKNKVEKLNLVEFSIIKNYLFFESFNYLNST